VLFDGEDMRNLSVKRTRAAMGYVSQEAVLFEGTVRWNLVAGIDDPASVTQAAIEKACEQARILSFIQSLPEGFETDLGMKGSRLSGGQRQVSEAIDPSANSR
jgi:ATP-binding cassette subfamily B (MDR/TAP) protein 1